MVPAFSIVALAEATDGLSGSDLRELCRNAAMVPVREFMQSTNDNHEALVKGQLEVLFSFSVWFDLELTRFKGFNLRPLTLEDFFAEDGSSPLPPTTRAENHSEIYDEPLD